MSARHPATAMILLLAMACNEDDPSRDPIGAGGSTAGAAGSAGASGAAGTGGNAGTSDSGGTGGDAGTNDSGGTGGSGPDASVPRIQAVIDGAYVRLSSPDPVSLGSCGDSLTLLQQVDGDWIPLQDDRPVETNMQFGSHYVNETYEPFCQYTAGCDVGYCRSINDPVEPFEENARLVPRELVQVGEYSAPTCERGDAGVPFDAGVDLDAGIQRVPALESRPPRGPLIVRVRYHDGASCASPEQTMDVPVE